MHELFSSENTIYYRLPDRTSKLPSPPLVLRTVRRSWSKKSPQLEKSTTSFTGSRLWNTIGENCAMSLSSLFYQVLAALVHPDHENLSSFILFCLLLQIRLNHITPLKFGLSAKDFFQTFPAPETLFMDPILEILCEYPLRMPSVYWQNAVKVIIGTV